MLEYLILVDLCRRINTNDSNTQQIFLERVKSSEFWIRFMMQCKRFSFSVFLKRVWLPNLDNSLQVRGIRLLRHQILLKAMKLVIIISKLGQFWEIYLKSNFIQRWISNQQYVKQKNKVFCLHLVQVTRINYSNVLEKNVLSHTYGLHRRIDFIAVLQPREWLPFSTFLLTTPCLSLNNALQRVTHCL